MYLIRLLCWWTISVYFEVSVAMLNNNEGGTSHLKGKDETRLHDVISPARD